MQKLIVAGCCAALMCLAAGTVFAQTPYGQPTPGQGSAMTKAPDGVQPNAMAKKPVHKTKTKKSAKKSAPASQ